MEKKMAQHAIFITGAASGIGLVSAQRLERLGFRIFAGVLPGEDTAPLRNSLSKEAQIIPLDITDAGQIASMQAELEQALGDEGLHGLFNNAGVAITAPIELVPVEALRRQIETNLIGHFAVTQALLPLIRKARGRIVNTSSLAGRVAMPGMGPYSISKFALEALTDTLRLELREWGIHVAAIEPGVIKTPIWKRGVAYTDEIVAEVPETLRRLYEPLLNALRNVSQRSAETGASAELVADAVEHAFTTPRPRTRYLVGSDARRAALVAWLLPNRWADNIIMREYNLKT
jgi:NAD(P)-dependent dehydrogenase (short-subunit alcohol dehydrogenase family)